MPITVNNETYLTAAEAAKQLGVARETFTRNVSAHLRSYKFGALRRTYYLQSEVANYAGPREVGEGEKEEE